MECISPPDSHWEIFIKREMQTIMPSLYQRCEKEIKRVNKRNLPCLMRRARNISVKKCARSSMASRTHDGIVPDVFLGGTIRLK